MLRTVDPDTGEILAPSDVPPRAVILRRLSAPFERAQLRNRGRYPYVPIRAVLDRLDQATGGQWDWRLQPGQFVELRMRRRTGGRDVRAYVSIGTLTIPGLGSRDGRGIQELDEGENEEGLSTAAIMAGADSRALRNAAEKFGLWKPGDEE